MDILYFFAELRSEILTKAMLILTEFGEETVFMVIAMVFLWCVNKYAGYYLLSVGFLGTQINQFLKATFKVPRPWIKDPNFEAVEAAKGAAGGYSFPSGHTQSGVGTFGAVARWTQKRWLQMLCIIICLIVPVTRLYLGVHTLQDVCVSIGIALALIFVLHPILQKATQSPRTMRILLGVMLGLSILLTVYMALIYDGTDNLLGGLKNAVKMLGCIGGFILVYELDHRFIRYETGGCWWVQLIKLIPGLGLALLLKELVYFALGGLPGLLGMLICRGVAYFLLVLFAGAVWPMTFKYIRKLDKNSC